MITPINFDLITSPIIFAANLVPVFRILSPTSTPKPSFWVPKSPSLLYAAAP